MPSCDLSPGKWPRTSLLFIDGQVTPLCDKKRESETHINNVDCHYALNIDQAQAESENIMQFAVNSYRRKHEIKTHWGKKGMNGIVLGIFSSVISY